MHCVGNDYSQQFTPSFNTGIQDNLQEYKYDWCACLHGFQRNKYLF